MFLGKQSYEDSKNAIITFNYHIIGLLRSSSKRPGGPECLVLRRIEALIVAWKLSVISAI